MKSYHVDDQGYYGEFGGAYIPEMLQPNCEELRRHYLQIMEQPSFKEEFNQLLREYVGRPTPLYPARRLSERYGCKIYLKREGLCHTGAHKVNNTIGQILVAKRLGKYRVVADTGAGQPGVAPATVSAMTGMRSVANVGADAAARVAANVDGIDMPGAEAWPACSGSRTPKGTGSEATRDWPAG